MKSLSRKTCIVIRHLNLASQCEMTSECVIQFDCLVLLFSYFFCGAIVYLLTMFFFLFVFAISHQTSDLLSGENGVWDFFNEPRGVADGLAHCFGIIKTLPYLDAVGPH